MDNKNQFTLNHNEREIVYSALGKTIRDGKALLFDYYNGKFSDEDTIKHTISRMEECKKLRERLLDYDESLKMFL